MLQRATMLVLAVASVVFSQPVAAFDKWDVQITPALHRMILDRLDIRDGPARERADAIFRAVLDEGRALDETFIQLGSWNGGLSPRNHYAIDDEFGSRLIADSRRRDSQNRALRWALVDAYFEQVASIPGVDAETVQELHKRHAVLLTLNDPLGPSPQGVQVELDEELLLGLPSFDDAARKTLREAVDRYTIEIEPLVRTYRDAAEAAIGTTSYLNASYTLLKAGDVEGAQESRREYIDRNARLVRATLPIRAAHDQFVATVASQLSPEQAQAFRRATSLLWSPSMASSARYLLRMERGLSRPDLPEARRKELRSLHESLELIVTEQIKAINASKPLFRDAAWQNELTTFIVDSQMAAATGEPPPTPPSGLPDYNAILTPRHQEISRIRQAVDRYLPESDAEHQP